MNDVIEFNKRKRVRDEASVWLVRLQEGLDTLQSKQLRAWVDTDPMHKSELLELAAVWDELAILTELAPLFDGVPEYNRAQKHNSGAWPSWVKASFSAGLVAICASGIWLLALQKSAPILGEQVSKHESTNTLSIPLNSEQDSSLQSQHYRTVVGQQSEVLLQDGSKATLNTDTHIEVQFTSKQRTIVLHRGESHFSVESDPLRPLIVMASGKSVRAVGTAFSVRKNTDTDIEVAVDEGQVAVYQHEATEPSNSATQTQLNAGEVLTIANNQQQLSHYDDDEMLDRLAWKQGMIVINDETLGYVIQEFGRYSEQKVLFADRTMGDIRVAGYFRLGDVDALLVALEKNFKIRSEYYAKNDTFVLSETNK